MEQVRHNKQGIGEVVSKEVISGFTFLNVRFENGREMRFSINCITMGVAFVKADCHQTAMQAFREQYAGQYRTICKCERLMK